MTKLRSCDVHVYNYCMLVSCRQPNVWTVFIRRIRNFKKKFRWLTVLFQLGNLQYVDFSSSWEKKYLNENIFLISLAWTFNGINCIDVGNRPTSRICFNRLHEQRLYKSRLDLRDNTEIYWNVLRSHYLTKIDWCNCFVVILANLGSAYGYK